MKILTQIASRTRRALSGGGEAASKDSPFNAIVMVADKGGDGKSTLAELLSLALEDRGFEHHVIECEADKRLGARLGSRVLHHELHQESLQQLLGDPDLLNVYWDRVFDDVKRGPAIVDLPANGSKLLLRWAQARSTRAMLLEGRGLTFALVVTAHGGSFSALQTSALGIQKVLPQAEIVVVLNPAQGTINPAHPGVRAVLEEIGCDTVLQVPACNTPEWGLLKNLGGFAQVALMDESDLLPHGVELPRAGRALEGLQNWLLTYCEKTLPLGDRLIERAQHR